MHDGGWWSFIRYDEKQDRPQVNRALVRRAAAYGRPYAGKIALMLVLILAITLLNLIPPLLTRNLIDYALPQGDVVRLTLLALGMIVGGGLSGLLGVGQRYLSAIVGEGVIYDLRVALYGHLQHMSLRFFTHTKTGELMSRLNNDVGGAQRAVTGTFVDLVTNVVTLVFVLAIMLRLEWRLTLLAVAVLPLFLIPARVLGRRVRGVVRQQMMYNAEMNAMMEETLNVSGALLVKLFGRTLSEVLRFSERAARVRQAGVRQAFLMRWFFLTVGLISAVGTALVFWAGGMLVLQGTFTLGTVVAFTAYLGMLYGPLSALTNARVDFATSMVSFERVFEALDLPEEIAQPADALRLSSVQGSVRFEGVSFSYQPGENVPGAAAGLAEVARFGWGRSASLPPLSQESGALKAERPKNERSDARPAGDDAAGADAAGADGDTRYALYEVSFEVKPGRLAALVGPERRGQDHRNLSAAAALRSDRRRDPHRRPRHPGSDAGHAGEPDRHGDAGDVPVQRHDPGEPALCPPRCDRRADRGCLPGRQHPRVHRRPAGWL